MVIVVAIADICIQNTLKTYWMLENVFQTSQFYCCVTFCTESMMGSTIQDGEWHLFAPQFHTIVDLHECDFSVVPL